MTLSSGSLQLELSPSVGGAIASFSWTSAGRSWPILRHGHTPLENVLGAACFPLVPFSNRIRDGCFEFSGRSVRLAPNMNGDPNPLHGQGWTSAWSVGRASNDEAAIEFVHDPGEWPWAYEARQEVRLSANALHLRLACTNRSREPMPCGLGFHSYFPCGPATRIRTQVEQVWTVDDDVLPIARMPAVGRYAIADDPACGRGLDNGYTGWSGEALFTDRDWPFEIELSSPQARYFQLYSPEGESFFAAEPVTHANAALNQPEEEWAALGIQLLEPGESMELESRIAVNER